MPARVDARCELRLPQELLDRIDAVAGGRGNRSRFARRALEAALPPGAGDGSRATARTPARTVAPAASLPAPDTDTPAAAGCPECSANMDTVDGRRVCPECGYADS